MTRFVSQSLNLVNMVELAESTTKFVSFYSFFVLTMAKHGLPAKTRDLSTTLVSNSELPAYAALKAISSPASHNLPETEQDSSTVQDESAEKAVKKAYLVIVLKMFGKLIPSGPKNPDLSDEEEVKFTSKQTTFHRMVNKQMAVLQEIDLTCSPDRASQLDLAQRVKE